MGSSTGLCQPARASEGRLITYPKPPPRNNRYASQWAACPGVAACRRTGQLCPYWQMLTGLLCAMHACKTWCVSVRLTCKFARCRASRQVQALCSLCSATSSEAPQLYFAGP